MFLIEWILALLGHVALACVLFNHVHAYASPHFAGTKSRKITEKLIFVYAVLPLPFYLYVLFWKQDFSFRAFPFWMGSYFILTKLVGIYFILRWLYRTVTGKLPNGAQRKSFELYDVRREVGQELLHGLKARLLRLVPFNQVTTLSIEEWEFRFANLPDDLDGFRICQLSDLHFTGLVDEKYFEFVVDKVNAGMPDLILITGDIVDKDECIPWVGRILSRLESRYGVYFVLGNHDQLVNDQQGYRREFEKIGFTSAAEGKWHRLHVGEAELLISGNEIPWYRRASGLPPKPESGKDQFLILLSHSPDQVGWAVNRKFHLMFAGHTHGGQIRLPLVGPIIAPSRYGIKYASGTFKIRNMLMHVSRGISGDEPIRINCPPELGFFTLVKSENQSTAPLATNANKMPS